MITVGELLVNALHDAGISHVWRSRDAPALPHLPSTELATAELTMVVADAHGAVGPAPGAALLPDGGPGGEPILRIGARPGARSTAQVLNDPVDLPAVVRAAVDDSAVRPGCVEVALVVDLDAPAPVGARPLPPARPALAVHLDLADVEGPVVILAGGGVLRSRAVDDVRRLAERAGIGVLNTWTAKGVFPWDVPNHLGTAGLQARDFELAGLADAGLVIACGVDPAEAPRYRWALTEVTDVAPWELGQVVERWDRARAPVPTRPPLYARLAEALGPHFRGEVAGSPAAAVLALKQGLPAGGLVAADPGPAGFWVARTFPTDEPGSVSVPAVGGEGFAAAAALAASVTGRPAMAVTAEPAGEITPQLVEEADRLGLELDVRVWGPSTGVDFDHTTLLEEVAGPVVAWT